MKIGRTFYERSNYLWYSGFLWRIMGINADNTIRLITDENVTSLSYGDENSNFNDSYVDAWLNDYFYNNLKGTDIITTTDFCQGAAAKDDTLRTDCTGGTILSRNVGIISMDEYELADDLSSYLNIYQNVLTMTPYTSSQIWYINSFGGNNYYMTYSSYGVRPVINIDSNATITSGNGTLSSTWDSTSSPYILNQITTGVTGLLKDKATSGEYVKYANKIYRVVSKDASGNTKLMYDGYYQATAGTNTTMPYGDNTTFSTTSGLGQTLNTTILDWLVPSDNRDNLMTNYTWYQKAYAFDSYTISLDETTPTRTIQATVGLIRIGEMLSGQSSTILTKNGTVASSRNNTIDYWTLTADSSDIEVWTVNQNGDSNYNSSTESYAVRPLIVVKASTSITSGNGTSSNPYQI